MAQGNSNLSNISNNDLVLLRRIAKKYAKVTVSTGTKKFQIEGTSVSVLNGTDGLSFISVPATNAIYKDGRLVTSEEGVKAAIRTLKQAGRAPGKSGKKASSGPELPEELRKQIEAFAKQANGRVIFDPTKPGGYKVQKLRPRQPKA